MRDNNKRFRNKSIGMRLSEEELNKLDEIARKNNTTRVDIVSRLIFEYGDLIGKKITLLYRE